MANYICTWIYCDSKEEESSYTQVGNNSSDLSFQEVYWRCTYVFFCTSIKNNPSTKHILFTNSLIIPNINGLSLEEEFSKLNVLIVNLNLTYKTPNNYFSSWKNQFYIFDILNYIGLNYEPEDCFVILDSDCIWVRDAAKIMNKIASHQVTAYTLLANENENIHGLTRLQMRGIYEDMLGCSVNEIPEYTGGEWFGATVSYIRSLNEIVPLIWNESMDRYYKGKLKFNEEAHMLSFLYYKINIPPISVNNEIRRMWTISSIQRDIKEEDMDLSVWHCPSEKKFAIARIFDFITRRSDEFWGMSLGNPFVDFIGKYFGIPLESDRNNSVETNIRKQIDGIKQLGKAIVIFGSGKYGQTVFELLKESGITPRRFVDNNKDNWGKEVFGVPIVRPTDILRSDYIVIASYASAEIKQQLLGNLFEENNDFIIYNFYANS